MEIHKTITTTTEPRSIRTKSMLKEIHGRMLQAVKDESLNFAINEQCTSLEITPSGHFLVGGFSDGTVRIFDLTNTFDKPHESAAGPSSNQDDDKDQEMELFSDHHHSKTTSSNAMLVASHVHQRYGAVATQIHPKGVHTDLQLQVCLASNDNDGTWAFCGVPRGSTELHAVHLQPLEARVGSRTNLLDEISVVQHSDGKLKGLGACAKVDHENKYLLLTGKGIKNIHIWSFEPPTVDRPQAIWTPLYDTQTNGNTIKLLGFCHMQSKLWAVSQSDVQNIRLWDLSHETFPSKTKKRPKRPPIVTVEHTAGAVGLAGQGEFAICGGYNRMRLVRLDQPDSPYNHFELALPAAPEEDMSSSLRRRTQRGGLKLIQSVASGRQDANHILMELDDGSLVHYSSNAPSSWGKSKSQDAAEDSTAATSRPPTVTLVESNDNDENDNALIRRTLAVAPLARSVVVAAVARYNASTGQGRICLQGLEWRRKKQRSSQKRKQQQVQQVVPQKASKKVKSAGADELEKKKDDTGRPKVEATVQVETNLPVWKPAPVPQTKTSKKQTNLPVSVPQTKTSEKNVPLETAVPPKTTTLAPPSPPADQKAIQACHAGKAEDVHPPSTQHRDGMFTPHAVRHTTLLDPPGAKATATTTVSPDHWQSRGRTPSSVASQAPTPPSNQGAMKQFLVQQTKQTTAYKTPDAPPMGSPPVPRKKKANKVHVTPKPERDTSAKAQRSSDNAPDQHVQPIAQSRALTPRPSPTPVQKQTPRNVVETPVPSTKKASKEQELAAQALFSLSSPPPKTSTKKATRSMSPMPLRKGSHLSPASRARLLEDLRTIQALLQSLPKSNALFELRLSKPKQSGANLQGWERKRFLAEVKASHVIIVKNMLRNAEGTLRAVLQSNLTLASAKAEIGSILQFAKDTAHSTVARQCMEATALVAQQEQRFGKQQKDPVVVSFTFKSSFDAVETIVSSWGSSL